MRDLQLHLGTYNEFQISSFSTDVLLFIERNHNIRIPGFSSDETRLSLSQTAIGPAAAPAVAGKKAAQGTHMTLRSQRLAQVQQAKREAKLM